MGALHAATLSATPALEVVAVKKLAAEAAAAGRIFQVGFWRRFSPHWRRAKDLLDQGAIGRPLLLRFAQWDAHPPPPAFCDPAVSGGLAIDCGVHEYDLAEWLTGERVERVSARNLPIVSEAVGQAGDVDNLVALLDLTGGATAVVDLTRNARYGDDVRTEILGAEGALFVDLLPTGRTRLATSAGVSVVEGFEVEGATLAGIVGRAQALAAAVRGEPQELPGAAASDRAVAIGRAVQRSARARRPVEL
jgi:predicted dehydrogenase